MDPLVLRYVVAFGWRIHPVLPKAKRPLIKDHLNRSTSDVGQLLLWEREFPGCRWGLATGERSGVVVIDIDKRPEHWGLDSLEELDLGGLSPATPTVHTPSGGLHWYFRWPGCYLRSTAGVLPDGRKCPGVDIRGDGGSAILPPEPGRFWDPLLNLDLPLAPLPLWARTRPQPTSWRPWRIGERKPEDEETSERAAKDAIDAAAREALMAQLGQQQHELNRSAFIIGQWVAGCGAAYGYGRQRLADLADSIPNLDARRPWDRRLLAKMLNRAFVAGEVHPRRAPWT
jgi:hypothetical protein